MRMQTSIVALLGLALAACGGAEESTSREQSDGVVTETSGNEVDAFEGATEAGEADYADMANWLCHPGMGDDACSANLDHTVVNADGTLEEVSFQAADAPPVDCFYVYPTISFDSTPNSDLNAGPEEARVAALQLGAFGETCRLFAPVYRQITLTHLQSLMGGAEFTADAELGFNDVVDAWNAYLETENAGRGVFLLGHSQGARMVERLMRETISGSDSEDLIVSAMPIGYTMYADVDTGNVGAFPICQTGDQIGCVIAYVTFRSDFPPPEDSRFGDTNADGQRAICVNPAELSGDNGSLDARLARTGFFGIENARFVEGQRISTPYASMPGMLSAECVETDRHTYLAVEVTGDPSDPRADDILGDVVVGTDVLRDWGLHTIDINVAMGNLVAIVETQAAAWATASTEE
ncbi:DUF3089 domain-containing protein [Henriciella barbarensis]|uniref:DUF3089 domain-containing protein n=1 Tax=Henriciella barbarensis TaxID=86342 RepID=A0A399QR18_9PROT|nr:DUF3089 domain-containing protein [Henriciella barbarensis]RIJ21376.1 DUF3089 domain-containing protein [Henriciella barbarensis]